MWVRMFWRCDALLGSRRCPERLGSSEDPPTSENNAVSRNGVYIHTQIRFTFTPIKFVTTAQSPATRQLQQCF
eukprot:1484315-Prymnesium_polylepis.1